MKKQMAIKPEPIPDEYLASLPGLRAETLKASISDLIKIHSPLALLRAILDATSDDMTIAEYLQSDQFGIAICKAEIKQCADTIQKRLFANAPLSETEKLERYQSGMYFCSPPPVCHTAWSALDWIAYIDRNGAWHGYGDFRATMSPDYKGKE